MTPEWRASTWGEEISLEYGKALRGHDTARGRYRVFGSNGPIGWTSEPLAPGPGVILGRKGAYRGVRFSREPFFVIDTAYYVVPKTELDTRWLYYAMLHYKLGEVDDGSPIPSTTRAAVYMLDLDVPPLPEQRAIGSILGTLDDKIELNRRMSETLEATVTALFTSWLAAINVELVKATDLIGEGVLDIGDGYRAKTEELGEPGVPFLRAGDLRDGLDVAGAERLRFASANRAGGKLGQPGDVVFASKGTIGRVVRVTESATPCVYSPQVCYWRSLDSARIDPVILYCWMKGEGFQAQVSAVSGQTDMAPYVSLRDQRSMLVPLFPPAGQIGDLISMLLARAGAAIEESRTLAALRDTLLPKIISGELRVKDAERLASAVA